MIATLPKNDKQASILIIAFSVIVFAAVTALDKIDVKVELGFDPHLFAALNAGINTVVAVLLVAGLISAKRRAYKTHRNIMFTAMVLSLLFLVSYILHHLFTGSTLFGDANHDGVVSAAEKATVGGVRTLYIILLSTHILLAGISLPFILFTAYRALINENSRHRKLAKITWPMWFYVAATGPIVYLLIRSYY